MKNDQTSSPSLEGTSEDAIAEVFVKVTPVIGEPIVNEEIVGRLARGMDFPPGQLGVTTATTAGSAGFSTGSVYSFTVTEDGEEELRGPAWEGPLAVEGHFTSDNRYLIPGEMGEREFPLPLMVQTKTEVGHFGAEVAGRIDSIKRIPAPKLTDEQVEQYNLNDLPEHAVVAWGEGTLDMSEHADDAQRLIENGAGVSVDVPADRVALIDRETREEVPFEEANLEDIMSGKLAEGIAGKYAGVTVVTIGAFEETSIRLVDEVALVASAYGLSVRRPLVASAAPLKPPRSWFDDPRLSRLAPLEITDEGRIFGHLADWDGCHTGFSKVCVPPFKSFSGFAFFNVGQIETAEGELVPVGKLMFNTKDGGHADTHPGLSIDAVRRHYDKANFVGGYVRAGSDRFGTWLSGCLRPDLTDAEIQHLRLYPPSGDWRPIPGKGTELVAAVSVAIPGFPIPRAMIASADDGLTIITGPLVVQMGEKERMRRRAMLRQRVTNAMASYERSLA